MSSDLRTGAEAPPTPDQSTETTHHHLIGKLGSVFWTSVSVSARWFDDASLIETEAASGKRWDSADSTEALECSGA